MLIELPRHSGHNASVVTYFSYLIFTTLLEEKVATTSSILEKRLRFKVLVPQITRRREIAARQIHELSIIVHMVMVDHHISDLTWSSIRQVGMGQAGLQ